MGSSADWEPKENCGEGDVFPQTSKRTVSEFIKHDQGKPDPSLIPYAPLLEVAKVLGHGAEKYGRDNWRQGTKDRYKAALGRHMFAYMDGEERDPETDLEHLAHVISNCLFLMELGDA